MEKTEIPVDLKSLRFLLHKALNIFSWSFDEHLSVLYTNCKSTLADQYNPLTHFSLYNITEKQQDFPVIVISPSGSAYAISKHIISQESCNTYHIIGPVIISNWSIPENNIQQDIPLMDINEFDRYASLLNIAVNNKKEAAYVITIKEEDTKADSHKELFEAMLNKIRNGDLNYKHLLYDVLSNRETIMQLGAVTFESGKQMAILSIDLCCKTAVESGVTQQAVGSIYNKYISILHLAESGQEIVHASNLIIYHLIRLIRKSRGLSVLSLPVQNCCIYIEENIYGKITLQDLAKISGYSMDHLSRIFKKEMNESIGSYIQRNKIYSAKLLLTTTDLSIGDIADKLSYCSNSHFSKTFKSYTGQTPMKYRSENEHLT